MLSYQMRRVQASLPLGALIALVGIIALGGALILVGQTTPLPSFGTGSSGNSQLPGTGSLIQVGEQAGQSARAFTSDPVLRQVDVDPVSGKMFFHFTDVAATFEIVVLVPSSTQPDQWQVSRPSVSKLVGHERLGLELQALRVDPADALRPLTAQWAGCAPRSLTLFGEGEVLTWTAFCTLADGRVAAGTTDGRSGAFQPSPAPPAAPAPTAPPSR